MNEKRILDAIGNADEKYILEAAPDISVFFNSDESIERGIDMDKK